MKMRSLELSLWFSSEATSAVGGVAVVDILKKRRRQRGKCARVARRICFFPCSRCYLACCFRGDVDRTATMFDGRRAVVSVCLAHGLWTSRLKGLGKGGDAGRFAATIVIGLR